MNSIQQGRVAPIEDRPFLKGDGDALEKSCKEAQGHQENMRRYGDGDNRSSPGLISTVSDLFVLKTSMLFFFTLLALLGCVETRLVCCSTGRSIRFPAQAISFGKLHWTGESVLSPQQD